MEAQKSKKVQANRQRKMADIRATALQIILELGLEGLSMHELARRRKVTVGALYRYYDSKQFLVVSLEYECLESVRDALSCVQFQDLDRAQPQSYAFESLRRIVHTYLHTLADNPAYERLISGILATPSPVVLDDDRAGAVQKMFEALASPTQQIQQLMALGIFESGEASERALILWVTVHGILQLKKMEDVSSGLICVDTLLEASLHTLVTGWSKSVDTRAVFHNPSILND